MSQPEDSDQVPASRPWGRRGAVTLGAMAIGGPLLAGCANDKPSGPAVDSGQDLVQAAEVPVGSGVVLSARNLVVTQPSKGTFKAFSNVCTHQGCPMKKVDKTIDCDCHGSKFSLEDGSPVEGPAQKNLEETPVKVVGGAVVTD